MSSLILCTATRFIVPLMLLFSIFVLLRGHNAPGGGFVGGLLAAAAFALHTIAFNVAASRRMMRIEPRTLIGLGLLIALASGAIPLAGDYPFLTGQWIKLTLPGLGEAEIGTPVFLMLASIS